MTSEVPVQAGNNHPTGVPTGVFPTADGYVNVAPTPVMWRRFCAAIDRPDLVDHPDFARPKDRRINRDRLNALIEEITRSMTSELLINRLNDSGIPCGPIYTLDQTFSDPQVKHLGMAQTALSDSLGEFKLVGQPFTLSRTPCSKPLKGAPEMGEHTEDVLAELGYDANSIADLRKMGAI
jgi:formyl-CoA transferase